MGFGVWLRHWERIDFNDMQAGRTTRAKITTLTGVSSETRSGEASIFSGQSKASEGTLDSIGRTGQTAILPMSLNLF